MPLSKVLSALKKYTRLLTESFDHQEYDQLFSDAEERPFSVHISALKTVGKHLKWRILNRIYEKRLPKKKMLKWIRGGH